MLRSFRSVALALAFALPLPALAQDSLPSARVVLPWDDFQRLYERGMAPKDKPEPAPQDVVISRAVYQGRVDGESVVFQARVSVDVLKDKGWIAVRLLPTTVALRQARIGNQDASIYLENGWYTLVTDRRGTINVDLEFAATVWDSSGQQGFAFGLAPSGGTEVAITVPSQDALNVAVANAQQVRQESSAAGRVIKALLPATGNLSVSWQRLAAETAEAALAARVYAEHQALVGVAEGLMSVRSTIQYSILHAGVEKLSVSVPETATILDVRGQGIRDWSVSKKEGRANIDVALNFEAKGAYTLIVDYETRLPEGSGQVTVPELRVNGVERVKGWVGIDARSSLELKPGEGAGVVPVDVRDLPAAILGQTDWPVLFGFKYNKPEYTIPLGIQAHEGVDLLVTLIDQTSATTVLTPDGRRMTQVVYAMRNNQAQFLRLKLPDGAVPWSTFVAGNSVKPGRAEDGRVLIPLMRSQTSGGELAQFSVELVYVEDGAAPDAGGKGKFAATLPQADVPSTGVAWTVYLPREATLKEKSVDGSLRRVDYFTPIPVPGQLGGRPAQVVQAQANAQYDGEAMAQGVQPVRVTLPLDGQPVLFEKLLVLGEPLDVRFDWKAAD